MPVLDLFRLDDKAVKGSEKYTANTLNAQTQFIQAR